MLSLLIAALLLLPAGKPQAVHTWRSIDADGEMGTFFDAGSLRNLSAGKSEAVFAIAWAKPDAAIYPNFRIEDVSAVEETWIASCAEDLISLRRRAYFSADGKELKVVVAQVLTPKSAKPLTAGGEFLNLLCGRPQELGGEFNGGPEVLVSVVRTRAVVPKDGRRP